MCLSVCLHGLSQTVQVQFCRVQYYFVQLSNEREALLGFEQMWQSFIVLVISIMPPVASEQLQTGFVLGEKTE